ncbi:TIGR03619 family F420-dependent LLM class oxidoreductase [Streptomyces smyrnaeus]|uniref:TIGR03619 family F420-dependent LLM class oxidoreductase n=1 Tax=Streptomyces TaxID=1883 RepID=UPI000C19B955|nr:MULTISPECIES: TIGR03619 family F420-dependent LLM class oxidoreductase [unclassified Streptomyces]MBQ0867701.1 TIGR03619 family F420-dependent LLM class oxidoreductase [Streptomyces sp. RK75]MBQ1120463.1 TIGR03619 family F420-dependent LLM class oxidoreductase [Streptomyces sp. B15]MBQ1159084.1 TIGR03619 family F420-dependent LLM class oxidoreductase [Streptomyces sp. A73]
MRISTTIMLTDETIPPSRLARALEERGFGGLYLPEHTHIPVSRQTPAPMGDPLPRPYGRTLDPMVALAAAATVTERLALGTSVTLVAQHDPIVLAKQIATLDRMCGGRFTLGVGFGWNVEEAADHNVTWRRRRDLVRERIALMRALWAPVPTAYEGEFGSVRASLAHPEPVRPGGPRLLVGGAAGPTLFAHVAEYADGWLPIGGSGLKDALTALHDAWRSAGRSGAPAVVPAYVLPSPGKLRHYRDLGAEEVLLQLPSGTEPEVLRTLDDYARYL